MEHFRLKRYKKLGFVAVALLLIGTLFVSHNHAKAEVANDVSSGLMLQWKMNEEPGSDRLADNTSSDNFGTLYDTDIFTSRSTDVPYTSGENSHSLLLNGTDTNDYATSTASVPINVSFSQNRTLCGWVKLTTTTGNQVAFNYGGQMTGGKFGVYASSGHWWFWGYSSADFDTGVATDTNWHNHCISYDGTTVNYYFDGSLVESAARSLSTQQSQLILGQRDPWDISQPLFGKLDDIRLYDRVLSQEEINEIANVQGVTIDTKPSNPSNDTTATFEFSSAGSAVTITCSIDASPAVSCVSPYVTSPLSNGPHSFTVTATYNDASTSSDSYDWTVDTVPPDSFVTRLGDTPASTPTTEMILTSNEPATFECNLDSAGYEACTSPYETPELADGEHNLLVRATDDAGNTDQTPASVTWDVDTFNADNDGDGIVNGEEWNAPNEGDANDDGVQDAEQPQIASFINPLIGNYQVIESDCDNVSNIQVGAEAGDGHQDNAYDYPLGITGFIGLCGGPGQIATFTQYFYGITGNDRYVLRKWGNDMYKTMPDFVLENDVIAGQNVFKVTYQIMESGEFDEDGEANGYIVDPAGLGIPVVAVPNTGFGNH